MSTLRVLPVACQSKRLEDVVLGIKEAFRGIIEEIEILPNLPVGEIKKKNLRILGLGYSITDKLERDDGECIDTGFSWDRDFDYEALGKVARTRPSSVNGRYLVQHGYGHCYRFIADAEKSGNRDDPLLGILGLPLLNGHVGEGYSPQAGRGRKAYISDYPGRTGQMSEGSTMFKVVDSGRYVLNLVRTSLTVLGFSYGLKAHKKRKISAGLGLCAMTTAHAASLRQGRISFDEYSEMRAAAFCDYCFSRIKTEVKRTC